MNRLNRNYEKGRVEGDTVSISTYNSVCVSVFLCEKYE